MVVAVIFMWRCHIVFRTDTRTTGCRRQSDKEDTDLRWSKALRDEMMDVKVDMHASLMDIDLPFQRLWN